MTNWQDELRQSFKSIDELETFFQTTFPKTSQPVFLPTRLANEIKKHGINSPLGKQFLPHHDENKNLGFLDPIGDLKPGPLPYFIHRYENRALFFPTTVCPVQCRYCFRKNNLHNKELNLNASFEKIDRYIEKHTEINEIIFSGGDPFILSTEKLKACLDFFSCYQPIKFIRFHTRVPSILPSRIDDELCEMLNTFKNRFHLTIVIHTNHSDELTDDVIHGIEKLSPFNFLSQTVLLKNVNDHEEALEKLFKTLNHLHIRPYYLHHPDPVKGGMHFYLSEEKGLKIYQNLRKKLSGWMLPQYVIDSPEASGKQLVTNNFNKLDNTSSLNY